MNAWRNVLAVVALQVSAAAAFYVVFVVVMPWATSSLGEAWSFSRIDA